MGWVLFDVFMAQAKCEMCSWYVFINWCRIMETNLEPILLGFGSLSCGLQFGLLDMETENE